MFLGRDRTAFMHRYINCRFKKKKKFLRKEGLVIPCLSIMTGDFNCHSMVWDPSYDTHRVVAAQLLELVQDLELDWDPPVNLGPTHVPHIETLNYMVIDLIFTPPGVASELPQRRMVKLQGPPDLFFFFFFKFKIYILVHKCSPVST
jgi:hypothetical protein